MKACLFLLAVLAALVAVNDAAAVKNDAAAVQNDEPVVKDTTPGANLILGTYTSGDRLLHSRYYTENPAGAPINGVYPYLGPNNVRITYIEAVQMGSPQDATAELLTGGVGLNYATIRLRSSATSGYYYLLRIYGR